MVQLNDKSKEIIEKTKESSAKSKKARELHDQQIFKINTHLIYLSAGSISLLLTFVGVLYGKTDSNIEQINFYLVIFAVICMLLAIAFLLTSHYIQSLLVYKREEYAGQIEAGLSVLQLRQLGSIEDGVLKKDINTLIKDLLKTAGKIDDLPKHQWLYHLFSILGYVAWLSAAVLAVMFFIEVISSI